MSTDILRSCPFCGGKGKHEGFNPKEGDWIKCEECGAETKYCESDTEAVAIWNTRTSDVKINDEDIESLTEALTHIKVESEEDRRTLDKAKDAIASLWEGSQTFLSQLEPDDIYEEYGDD